MSKTLSRVFAILALICFGSGWLIDYFAMSTDPVIYSFTAPATSWISWLCYVALAVLMVLGKKNYFLIIPVGIISVIYILPPIYSGFGVIGTLALLATVIMCGLDATKNGIAVKIVAFLPLVFNFLTISETFFYLLDQASYQHEFGLLAYYSLSILGYLFIALWVVFTEGKISAPKPAQVAQQTYAPMPQQTYAQTVQSAQIASNKPAESDPSAILEYKELLDTGVITQEEFEAKKKELLGI